ncbi:flagellar hook capping FlgD N-terminal domain-containing protein [uncultured Amnibacterium sp.]|uniref:flagellar hook capping FlgD N-terminal domain-containing protein n=1 Tax=uncultured Amnibacterium sp. TaxID=1631851 RepID=UPI0035C99F78
MTTTTTGATTGTTGTSIYSSGTGTSAKANQEYNSELFMKLLVTQLSNQDPSSPMDSSQMVAQTAQLASMEQLTSLNSTTTSTHQSQMQSTATSMLGRSVSWTDSNGAAQTGKVASISFSSTGAPQLTIGSSTVALTAITGVSAS